MDNNAKSFRFDVAALSPERLEQFIERLDMTAFLKQHGKPNGKIVFFDAQFYPEPDIPAILKDFEDVKYIDYSNVPSAEWKYPFS